MNGAGTNDTKQRSIPYSHRTSVPFSSALFHSKHERPINDLLFKQLGVCFFCQ